MLIVGSFVSDMTFIKNFLCGISVTLFLISTTTNFIDGTEFLICLSKHSA